MGQLALNGRSKKFKQGVYIPKNKEKFFGKDGYAIYRSGLELNYFRILDNNPNVLKWGSEEIVVPYFFCNDFISSLKESLVATSSADIGSSNRITFGFIARARTIATLCF